MNSNFPTRLAEAMKATGHTQESLAAKLGISHSAVSRWISGSKPRPARLVELSKVLGVDVSWLEIDGLNRQRSVRYHVTGKGSKPAPPGTFLDLTVKSDEATVVKEDSNVYNSSPPPGGWKAMFLKAVQDRSIDWLIESLQQFTADADAGNADAQVAVDMITEEIRSRSGNPNNKKP